MFANEILATVRRKRKADLLAWAEEHCLLEHLDHDEAAALTHAQLLAEIDGALLRVEVYEDGRAMVTDTVLRPTSEIIGCQL